MAADLNIFSTLGTFNKDELELANSETKQLKINNGDFLIQPGQVCKACWYLYSGSIKQYQIDRNNEKKITNLFIAGDWIVDSESYLQQKESQHFIEANERSTLFTLDINAIHRLIQVSASFFQLGAIFDVANKRISFFDNYTSPDEKYMAILTDKPALLQAFTQKIIASYLKITPETLSRVRNRLRKDY